MALSDHQQQPSFISNVASLSGAGPEYRLHRCTPFLSQNKLFFATRPISMHAKPFAETRAVIGIYDQRQSSLMSILDQGTAQVSRICGLAPWRQGIVVCGPEGITYMNGSSFQTKRLLGVDIGISGFRCLGDIAVLGHDSSIWFTDTDFSFHDATASKIYCFNPFSGRLHAATSDVEVPVNIAFSADSSKCYVSDAASSSIKVYDVVAENTGYGYTLVNGRRFVYLDTATTSALKTDKDGMVYAACENRIVCWNERGLLRDRFWLDAPVADFFVQGRSITVVHAQAIIELDLHNAELDARL